MVGEKLTCLRSVHRDNIASVNTIQGPSPHGEADKCRYVINTTNIMTWESMTVPTAWNKNQAYIYNTVTILYASGGQH